jgi:hypothetical protein
MVLDQVDLGGAWPPLLSPGRSAGTFGGADAEPDHRRRHGVAESDERAYRQVLATEVLVWSWR